MKGWAWVPLALVAGLVLGGWGPRQDVRRLKNELELAQQNSRRGSGGVDTLGALGRVIPLPDRRPDAPATAPAAETAVEAPADTNAPPAEPGPEHVDFKARIDEAMEAWRLRSELVRNSFVTGAALTPEQTAQFDVAVAAMNLRIKESLGRLAERLRAGEEPNAEDGLRLINELSGHVVRAYDDLDRSLPPSWRAGAGDRFNAGDLIDPSVAEPLIGLEGRLQGMRGDRPWRRRGHAAPGGGGETP